MVTPRRFIGGRGVGIRFPGTFVAERRRVLPGRPPIARFPAAGRFGRRTITVRYGAAFGPPVRAPRAFGAARAPPRGRHGPHTRPSPRRRPAVPQGYRRCGTRNRRPRKREPRGRVARSPVATYSGPRSYVVAFPPPYPGPGAEARGHGRVGT